MLIGVLSDTHNQRERTVQAIDQLMQAGAEFLIHCGDFTNPSIVSLCGAAPFACVLGNNDFDAGEIERIVGELGGTYLGFGGEILCGGKRVAVTHGDNPAVFRKLVAAEPDYLLFGHTHLPLNERDGATRQVNPGALYRAPRYTVAIIDTEADTVAYSTIR